MNRLKLFLKPIPIKFNEQEHTYQNTDTNEFYTGVTTILNVKEKPFLKWWTAKEVVKFLADKHQAIKDCTPDQYTALLDEAKKAHVKKSDQAKDKGHIVHAWIEEYINSCTIPEVPEDEQIEKAIEQFLAWEKAHTVYWLACELVVASITHKFAGTIDAVAAVDNKLALIDFKTSSQISDDYFLQTAAYQIALEEMGLSTISQRMILRVPKDGSEFESMVVPTELDFDKEVFLHLRQVHRWNVNIENNYSHFLSKRSDKKSITI